MFSDLFSQILDPWAAALIFPALVVFVVIGIDDFLLDVYAWFKGFQAGRVDSVSVDRLKAIPQSRIAIAVAAWREHEIIGRMVRGNLERIHYENYEFYIGVYPNDTETVNEVKALCAEFPQVHMVVNRQQGPSSKGQMLNEIMDRILSVSESDPCCPDAVLIHDAEDVIHPDSLLAINGKLPEADFMQVPVYSLPTCRIVGGTYMDEFGEVHTKDLRVRAHLAPAIPGAGVGMVVKRELLKRKALMQGQVFNNKSLSEDYELGLSTAEQDGRCHFLLVKTDQAPAHAKVKHKLIATHEHFPKTLRRAIRQKTRWTTGIVFQGTKNLGWRGNWIQKYFFYRDRKGLVLTLFGLSGLLLSVYVAARHKAGVDLFTEHALRSELLTITYVFAVNRLFQRWYACYHIYGLRATLLMPLRVIAGNIVNSGAAINSIVQYTHSAISGATIKWAKTEHELPEGFGLSNAVPVSGKRSSDRERPPPPDKISYPAGFHTAGGPAAAARRAS